MPPAGSSELRKAVARSGGAARHGNAHSIEEASRDLAAERIATYIGRIVEAAPPLTAAQRDRLASLLKGGGDHGPS